MQTTSKKEVKKLHIKKRKETAQNQHDHVLPLGITEPETLITQ